MKEPLQVSRRVLCTTISLYKVRPMAFSEFRRRKEPVLRELTVPGDIT